MLKNRKRLITFFVGGVCAIILAGFVFPEHRVIPVEGATHSDWNKESFWHDPWGTSGVHKGIDIFAKMGTELRASTGGLVVYTGNVGKGGNVILILGPKWRFHYYAHLKSIDVNRFQFVSSNQNIGRVGDSGNAKGKSPHVHYTIATVIPYPWEIKGGPQGWKRMFYLDPGKFLHPEDS